MTNPEYLAGIKQADDIWHKSQKISFVEITNEDFYEYRIMKALEIIAEELININSNFCNLVTILENIETAIKQR